VGTGVSWTAASFTNSVRKISGDTTPLQQTLSVTGTSIRTTYATGYVPYRVDYQIFGDNNTGSTFTVVFGGVSGTTRTLNGTYYDIFYVYQGNDVFLKKQDGYYIVTQDGGRIKIDSYT
jgi:hypothetical protein